MKALRSRLLLTGTASGLLLLSACSPADNDPVALVLAANEALWNEKDIRAVERYFSATLEYQTPYSTTPGRDGLREDVLAYYDWVEANESTFLATAGEGNLVFLRWQSNSQPKGEVATYNNQGIDFYTVENGIITTLVTAHEIDSTARNKALVQRLIEELWNGRDVTVIDTLFAPNAVVHITDFESGGREKVKADAERFFKGWSDHETTLSHMVAEGDTVTIRWQTTATHTGLYGTIPATGKTMTYHGMDIYRFEEDKIVETWSFWDAFDVYQKLGVLELNLPPGPTD